MKSLCFVVVFTVMVLMMMSDRVSCGTCREQKLCCPGRDSSCVVQKTPLNTIGDDVYYHSGGGVHDNNYLVQHHQQQQEPRRLDDDGIQHQQILKHQQLELQQQQRHQQEKQEKPCYCDHACLKLGDCCHDFKETCGVVDCQVSPWGSWTKCDADCGSGTMSRTRTVLVDPQNGGRHCPSLEQRRGCQVSNCHHHQDPAIREIAILLPGSLSKSRKANETVDVRRNLRLSFPEDHPESDPSKEYGVEFQVVKTSKACKKEPIFEHIEEGSTVCVRCENEALRKNLGYRCQGHGVPGLFTRWSYLSAPHCHGKWVRKNSTTTDSRAISCPPSEYFIFV